MTTIIIEKQTRNRLKKAGRKEQTYDDIINELLRKTNENPVNSSQLTEQYTELS
jgi:hypothetical protein